MSRIRKPILMFGLVVFMGVACAKEVCRHVDESGRVTYTDLPPGKACAPVKMRTPVNPTAHDYEAARIRADSERLQQQRLQIEERQRRPVVTYDPRRSQNPPDRPRYTPSVNIRHDPNLPDAPPPGSAPRYYYDGR